MTKEGSGLYAQYRETALTAARKLWGMYGSALSERGIELDDLTQHAELTLLELLPKLDESNVALPNFIHKSVLGSLCDRFIKGELKRFSNQTPTNLIENCPEPTPKLDKLLDESLLLGIEGLDLAFCELVMQGYKPHEARRLVGWNLAEYREAKQRIAEKMGVEHGN